MPFEARWGEVWYLDERDNADGYAERYGYCLTLEETAKICEAARQAARAHESSRGARTERLLDLLSGLLKDIEEVDRSAPPCP